MAYLLRLISASLILEQCIIIASSITTDSGILEKLTNETYMTDDYGWHILYECFSHRHRLNAVTCTYVTQDYFDENFGCCVHYNAYSSRPTALSCPLDYGKNKECVRGATFVLVHQADNSDNTNGGASPNNGNSPSGGKTSVFVATGGGAVGLFVLIGIIVCCCKSAGAVKECVRTFALDSICCDDCCCCCSPEEREYYSDGEYETASV